MFLVKNSNDVEVARFVSANLKDPPPNNWECTSMLDPIRAESMAKVVELSFLKQVPGPQGQVLRRYYEMGRFSTAYQTPAERDVGLKKHLENLVNKQQQEFLKQQLQNLMKQQKKQQKEMASIWRDLMKIENETLIRKMRDPNPLVSLLAIQATGRKRLPVEKECIGLLSNVNPTICQAARETLIRLGRGVDFGPEPSATPQQVAASVRSWSSWSALQTDDAEENGIDIGRK